MIKPPGAVTQAIKRAEKIGLMTHRNGDGDAFGSMLGLQLILEKMGKEVVIFSNEELPPYFDYFKKEIDYNFTEKYEPVDLLIGLDLVSIERFTLPEICERALEEKIELAVIDHHTEGEIHDIAKYLWRMEEVSSTAEMIYWLSVALDVEIDKLTAQLLLTGLEHDTYFLTNRNVYKSTESAQKGLQLLGGDTTKIRKSVEEASPTKNKVLMGWARKNMIETKGTVFTYLTMEQKTEAELAGENISSVISSYYDTEKKPKISICAEERMGGLIKVSMRSNHSDINVAEISKKFGGGGHIRAAAFELEGNLADFIRDGFFDNIINNLDIMA